MRLVHGEQHRRRLAQHRAHVVTDELFRGEEDERRRAAAQQAVRLASPLLSRRGVERDHAAAPLAQPPGLVPLQRHQGRDHHRRTAERDRRRLVDHRLSAPAGHHHQAVPARDQRLGGLSLRRPQLGNAEHLLGKSSDIRPRGHHPEPYPALEELAVLRNPIHSGPYAACSVVATPGKGRTVYYHCFVVNAYGNSWTHVRIAGTSTQGWIYDGDLDNMRQLGRVSQQRPLTGRRRNRSSQAPAPRHARDRSLRTLPAIRCLSCSPDKARATEQTERRAQRQVAVTVLAASISCSG